MNNANTPRNPWILPLGPVEIVAPNGTVTIGGLIPVVVAYPVNR